MTIKKTKSLILLITGTPGTGKSTIAKRLGKKLKAVVVNEKAFCRNEKCATFDSKTKEWEIDLKKYKTAFARYAKQHAGKPIILEGHVACEVNLPISKIMVLTCNPVELGYRLAKRRYAELKIQENMFCEATDYCMQQVTKHYRGKKVLKVDTSTHSPSQVIQKIQKWLH
ncbi:MAG: AAA family ATPase [Candidatus Iainarchaeum archaeon]|uniref:AAA family ATPase n=1 Tax=Candidatus Iainarchaeum sp. TaxID=3101447 RepID=A0A7T9DKB6_9ARCH|nr:MAG: AAA family ATPase [Candidatus Diapherotrites archaeon]